MQNLKSQLNFTRVSRYDLRPRVRAPSSPWMRIEFVKYCLPRERFARICGEIGIKNLMTRRPRMFKRWFFFLRDFLLFFFFMCVYIYFFLPHGRLFGIRLVYGDLFIRILFKRVVARSEKTLRRARASLSCWPKKKKK